MPHPAGARSALFVMLLLATVTLAPLASADHAYSHRYIIYGRVVDVNGDPVPNLTVQLVPKDFKSEDICRDQPGTDTEAWGKSEMKFQTDQRGQWMYCFHTHTMSRALPGSAAITVPYTGGTFTTNIEFDAHYRTQFVPIKLPVAEDGANRQIFDHEYTVLARLWRPDSGEPSVETVRVFGDVLSKTPVNVTLTLPDGTVVNRSVRTNNYGDLAIRLEVPQRVTGGKVKLEADGQTFETDADPTLGITTFKAEFPKKSDPFVRNAAIGAGVVALVAVLVGFGWWGLRKMKAKREDDMVRRETKRKRANR